MIGFSLICACTALTAWTNPFFSTGVPAWQAVLAALCLFTYSTLDNMDGKQARKTGTGSALGLLFDHGCDAVNAGLLGPLTAAAVLNTGVEGPYTLVLWSYSITLFYVATWEEFHTGHLILPIVNGPNEGLLMTMGTFLVTGLYGHEWWTQELPAVQPWVDAVCGAGLWTATPLLLVAAGCAAAAVVTGVYQVVNVSLHERSKGHSAARALLRLWPIVLVLWGAWGTYVFAPEVFRAAPRTLIVAVACVYADATSKLMISHVCEQRFRPWWPGCVMVSWLPLHTVLRAAGVLALWEPKYDVTALTVVAVIAAVNLVWFALYAVNELAGALGIHVFHIPSRKVE